MVEATENPTPVDWLLLSDVLSHVIGLTKKPEADIRSDILEAMRRGKLAHQVERTIHYSPRPVGMHKSERPPMEVTCNKPMQSEALALGVSGRGSLHIDWQNSHAVRRAGAEWGRIEFEGIRCSREHVLVLWPTAVAQRAGPVVESTAVDPTLGQPPAEPTIETADVAHEPPPRRSRRRQKGQGTQTRKARRVLSRIFPDGNYPSEEELPSPDLWDRFLQEYARVEGKASQASSSSRSRYDMPSKSTVMRVVGRHA